MASISVTVQVLFLDIAMPKGKSRADLVKSYDRNLGFPTEEMVKQMKESIQRINDMKTYSDWFKVNHMTRLSQLTFPIYACIRVLTAWSIHVGY